MTISESLNTDSLKPLKVRCTKCRKIYKAVSKDATKYVDKYVYGLKYVDVPVYDVCIKAVQDALVEKEVCIASLTEEVKRLNDLLNIKK